MTGLTAVLLPAVTAAQDSAKRMQCMNNIKQMMPAMHNYHDAMRCLPPVMTADANGKPLHSWRVLRISLCEDTVAQTQGTQGIFGFDRSLRTPQPGGLT